MSNDNAVEMIQWLDAAYVLSIISLTTSVVSVGIVALSIYYKRQFYERRSIRIGGLLGFLISVSSILGIVQHQHEFMSQRSSLQLRVINWLYKGTELSVCTLSLLLAVHLSTVLLGSPSKWTVKAEFGSELLAVAAALLTTHPILYICNKVEWDSQQRSILFDNQHLVHRWQTWAVNSSWVGLIIVINTIITLLILVNVVVLFPRGLCLSFRELPSSKRADLECASRRPDNWVDEINWRTLRLLGYVQLPLVTMVWEVASAINHAPWLYGLQMAMASTQGILCLALLLANPVFNPVWHRIIDRIKKQPAPEQLCLNFVECDKSTIYLSPYHSRTSSINL
ncbi:hypothetical protein BX667DRAFT_500661 [Coemansia mojavensis]|nr:hypothetical protein BX667DRAFT_500661 [Coemansia mojavensis]